MSKYHSIDDTEVELNRDRVWNFELREFSHNAVILGIR